MEEQNKNNSDEMLVNKDGEKNRAPKKSGANSKLAIIIGAIAIAVVAIIVAAFILILGRNGNNNNNGGNFPNMNSGIGNNNANSGNECVHSWVAATCTTPKKCSKCNEIEGGLSEHTWTNATCTSPKRCSECNESSGSALGHSWKDATCTEPKNCSRCNETQGAIGDHSDSGNGRCKYCNKDILLLEMQDGFDVRLIIPTVGGMNAYCTVKYTNNTKYTISSDMTFLDANGKLLYNSEAKFTLQSNYYATATYYRAILPSGRYDSKNYDLYLDNSSLAYTNVIVNGKTVFVRFGSNGPVAFGYSLADIGVF